MDSTKPELGTSESPNFSIDFLKEIKFKNPRKKRERIIVDSKKIPKVDLKNKLVSSGILEEEDSPLQIILFAKKEGRKRSFGILANMGAKDLAGLYVTSENYEDINGEPIFSVTVKCPRRDENNKYDHTETNSGPVVEDPVGSKLLNEVFGAFMASYTEEPLSMTPPPTTYSPS